MTIYGKEIVFSEIWLFIHTKYKTNISSVIAANSWDLIKRSADINSFRVSASIQTMMTEHRLANDRFNGTQLIETPFGYLI